MKVFFAASLHGKSKFAANYQAIVSAVTEYGHTIIADHVLSDQQKNESSYEVAVIDDIKKADVLFAEVSHPSVSVGYMISMAIQANKPVVVFYSGSQEPRILKTLEKSNDKLQVIRYSALEELSTEIPFVLDFAASAQDVRFNFFVSPDLANYLDWVSRQNRTPRSVYLRQLIDNDMAKEGEFVAEAS